MLLLKDIFFNFNLETEHSKHAMKYINIHTHSLKKEENVISITNIKISDIINTQYKNTFSIGIHPWEINTITEHEIKTLKSLKKVDNLLAIGECGIDKIKNQDIEIQKEIFLIHINKSEELGIPLIIHNVKASNEIIELHKIHKPQSKWIIHGFNKNSILAKEFTKRGIYISIGGNILNNRKLQENLKDIDLKYLFLENDDSDISIIEIYSCVAKILDLSIDNLKQIIFENYRKCFK